MSDLREQTTDWLEEMGLSPEKEPDPETHWHLTVEYPAGSGQQMHVVQPPGKTGVITIATVTDFSPPHVKAFEKLPDGQKKRFQLEFRRTLNEIEVEYQVRGANGPLDCPESFQVSRSRYEDGLTLDSFAHSVGAVYKTKLDAIMFINQKLSSSGAGPEDRFDFERLGI